jgi:tetratricopeptide (TPR) repeat protein
MINFNSIKGDFFKITATIFLISILLACGGQKTDSKMLSHDSPYMADSTIARLTNLLESNPNSADTWYQRAQAFYNLEGFDEAIGDMSAAMMIDTANVDYHLFLSKVYIDYYKSRLALNTLLRASVLFPENIEVLLKLSELQLALKFHRESLFTLDKVLQLDPQNALAYYYLGSNYKELADTAMAVGSYQKAVNFDPDLRDAWINMAVMRAARKEIKVERYFDAAILVDQGGYVAKMAKAEYLWSQEKYEAAKIIYRDIIDSFPDNPDNHYNLGLVLLEQDSLEAAKKYFNITLNMQPGFYKALYYRGLVYERLGDKANARSDYEQCIQMMPNFDKPRLALEAL